MTTPRASGRTFGGACCAPIHRPRDDVPVTRSYFAADAAQPPSVAVRDALAAALSSAWAQPDARSYEGRSAAVVLEAAARSIAASAGAPDAFVAVTPSAASALSVAVAGAGVADLTAVAGQADRQTVLTAIQGRNQRAAPALGVPEPILPVDSCGRLDLDTLAKTLAGGSVAAVCTQVGNPEIGTCADLEGIAAVARAAEAVVVLDATMSAGRSVMPDSSLWDIAVLWSNSWAGGTDVAAVVAQPGVRWSPPAPALPAGAPPRPSAGTWLPWGAPSVPLIASAAIGLEACLSSLHTRVARDRSALDRLRASVSRVDGVEIYGCDPRLPHVLGLSVLYVDAEALASELDARGVAVSSGSACVTGGRHSHVLEAIGGLSSGNVRITLPLEYDEDDVELAAQTLPAAIRHAQAAVGL